MLSVYLFVYVHVSILFHFIMVYLCNFYFHEYIKKKKKKKECASPATINKVVRKGTLVIVQLFCSNGHQYEWRS